MRKLGRLVWKEALAEARGLERVPTLALLAAVLLLTFRFALPPERHGIEAGFLWASVVFAAVLELRMTAAAERRDGALDGLRASPLDPTLLFAAKAISTVVVLALLSAVLVPAAVLLFGARASGIPAAFGVLVAASVGLVAWGTTFAFATEQTRSGEAVLPLLLFPLLVPETIAAVKLLGHVLGGARMDDPLTAVVLLAAFDALAVGTSLLLFEYVLEE